MCAEKNTIGTCIIKIDNEKKITLSEQFLDRKNRSRERKNGKPPNTQIT